MTESTYKVIEVVGSSSVSWEQAAKNAIEEVSKSIRNIRVAEIVQMDLKVEDGGIVAFRTRINISFKYGKDAKSEE